MKIDRNLPKSHLKFPFFKKKLERRNHALDLFEIFTVPNPNSASFFSLRGNNFSTAFDPFASKQFKVRAAIQRTGSVSSFPPFQR